MAGQPRFDQGYAWVVTFACFVDCFIMAGLARAAGVLYVAVIEMYGVSREAASAPFSIRYSVRNMAGPLVGALGQRYGIRVITMAGGLLAGIGGALCALAPDVFWLTVFWGGVHGIGYGLCNLIHIMILNQYFDKYTGSALGLSLAGDCFGTFAFPMILELLLQNYGVNGTFLILGGIALNVIPAGQLMRAPDWEVDKGTSNCPAELESKDKGILNKAFELDDMPHYDASNEEHKVNRHLTSHLHVNNSLRISNCNREQLKTIKNSDEENIQFYIENHKNDLTRISYSSYLDICPTKLCVQEINTNDFLIIDSNKLSSETKVDSLTVGRNLVNVPFEPSLNITTKDKDIERSAVVQFFLTNTRPLFILIAITLSAFQFLFIAVITVIIDYAADVGIASDSSKYLVIGLSIADLIGRLGFGVVLDNQWIKCSHFAALTTCVMGISVLAIPVCSNFYYLMSCMALCGLVMGGNCIMYPILVGKYMDKKEQTMAMGCVNMYAGLLIFSLAPMIGFFRDTMGSYDGVFWTVGIICVVAGLLWIFEPQLCRMQQRMAQKDIR